VSQLSLKRGALRDEDVEGDFHAHNVVAAIALVALSLIGAMPARAAGTRQAFCLQGDEYPGLS
jgi:hypothetical protein